MDPDWKERVLKASRRETEAEENEFLDLVDQACGQCSLEVARVLMKTFSDRPDFETQESVISALATADEEDVTKAMLEELPRLIAEAPEWAESLVGLEIMNRATLLQRIARQMPSEVRTALRQVFAWKSFQDLYPTAKDISL